VREQFLVELTGEPDQTGRHHVTDLFELNRLFTAWVETVYHRQIHSETGQAPLARWAAGAPFPVPTPAALAEAFLWEQRRTAVTKTATVSLHGNIYQVEPELAGRRVELVFDPFDLTTVEVRVAGIPAGTALPHHISRHAHPKARPETPLAPPPATGIDYAGLLDTAHQAELAQKVNYAALADPTGNPEQAEHNFDQHLPLHPYGQVRR
jgi:putative transposase